MSLSIISCTSKNSDKYIFFDLDEENSSLFILTANIRTMFDKDGGTEGLGDCSPPPPPHPNFKLINIVFHFHIAR